MCGSYKKGLEGTYSSIRKLRQLRRDVAQDGAYYKEFMPMSDLNAINAKVATLECNAKL